MIVSLNSADCSPLFDSSDRLESIDQVDVIVVSSDGAMINRRPGEQEHRADGRFVS